MYPIGFGPIASEVSPVATTSRVHDNIVQVPTGRLDRPWPVSIEPFIVNP